MTSITVSTPVDSNNLDIEETKPRTDGSNYPIENYKYLFQWSTESQVNRTGRALSYNEQRIQSTVSSHNNRFRHLCTRLKRRFTISKDYHPRTEDLNRGLSVCLSNYKPFSSSSDDPLTEFDWPDFEKVYDTIPHCLARALPGLDDISLEDADGTNKFDTERFVTDEENEQEDLFEGCKRGKYFRRNAICRKLDKAQYHGQLDTFIQQLMVEKLMRTWT